MTIQLVGGASTQSRARRPLPPGAVSAVTLGVIGVIEGVAFTYPDGRSEVKELLSWVGGQSGLLWGSPLRRGHIDIPVEILQSIKEDLPTEVHGSYGHRAEHALADALGDVYAGLLSSDDMAVRFFQNGGDSFHVIESI